MGHRGEDANEGLSGRPLLSHQVDVEVTVLGVEVGVSPVGERLWHAEVAARDANVAVDDSDHLAVREAAGHRSFSSSVKVSTVHVGQPHPRKSLSPVRMGTSSTMASATVGQSRGSRGTRLRAAISTCS